MKHMKRRKVVRKAKAAKKFNKSVHRTKAANTRGPVMRGGIRF